MARLFENVSFPIQGRGETARVGDRWPLRLLSLSGCTIGPEWGNRGKDDMASPFWRVYLNLDDGAWALQGARSYPLRSGAIMVLPAWCSWRTRCTGSVRHGNALVDLPSIGREKAMASFPAPIEVCPPGDPLSLSGVELLTGLAGMSMADEATEARGVSWIWAVTARLLEQAKVPGQLTRQGDFAFQSVLHRAEQRLGERLDRKALAAMAGLSEAELARRFHEFLGTSPARWVRQRRMAYAAQMLRQTDEPLAGIAERTGLGDRAQFSKTFAKIFGIGPATWRRKERHLRVPDGHPPIDG